MAFYAQDFIYDDIPSAFYGITITSEGNGEISSVGAGNISLMTQSIFRRPKPFFYGVQQTPVLVIPVSFKLPNDMDAYQESAISKWLFGQQEYRKLRIVQPDMQTIYYNCLIVDQQLQRVGNLIRGYTYNMVCDAPWAWEDSKVVSYTYPVDSYHIEEIFTINNITDNMYYTYPTIDFTTNTFGGSIYIRNLTDNAGIGWDRYFGLTSLSAGEVIHIDNDLEYMTSSTSTDTDDLKRLTNFNNTWVRLLPGENSLKVSGHIKSFSFTYPIARKVA